MNDMDRKLILASASPRRRELLERLQLNFTVQPADIDESRFPNEDAASYPLRTAIKKAMDVAEKEENALVLAADTVVVLDDEAQGCGRSQSDASSSGRT